MSRRRKTWFAIAGGCLLLGCVRLDDSHCANLQGDATCAARDATRAFCSDCTADNDGCVSAPVEADCVPSLDASSSSLGDGSATIADGGDDPSVASDASADGAATTADSTATNVSDDDADSVGEGDAGSTSSDPSTTTASADDGPLDDDDTSTMTQANSESSAGGPECGNGVREGDEECDGEDLDGATCLELPTKADGVLSCDAECMFNTTQCNDCVDTAGVCATDEACCVGHCNLNLCVL